MTQNYLAEVSTLLELVRLISLSAKADHNVADTTKGTEWAGENYKSKIRLIETCTATGSRPGVR